MLSQEGTCAPVLSRPSPGYQVAHSTPEWRLFREIMRRWGLWPEGRACPRSWAGRQLGLPPMPAVGSHKKLRLDLPSLIPGREEEEERGREERQKRRGREREMRDREREMEGGD